MPFVRRKQLYNPCKVVDSFNLVVQGRGRRRVKYLVIKNGKMRNGQNSTNKTTLTTTNIINRYRTHTLQGTGVQLRFQEINTDLLAPLF